MDDKSEKKRIWFLRLRRYWMAVAAISFFFLLLFGVAEAFGASILTDPSAWLTTRGLTAAAIGVTLLIVDVWLPVPSSIIMLAHGNLFGIWLGTVLSLIGSVGASLIGFWTGRASTKVLRRLVTHAEYEIAGNMLKKWGTLAVLVTRPVPILAETVAILAGASPMKWRQHIIASVAGILPAAFLYALAGATALNVTSGILIFTMVILLAGIFWLIGHMSATRQGAGSTEKLD